MGIGSPRIIPGHFFITFIETFILCFTGWDEKKHTTTATPIF